MSLKVRPFFKTDVDKVCDMHKNLLDGWGKNALLESFDNALNKSFVLENDGSVVAFCAFLVSDDAELVFICTKNEEKRKGYAQILLDEAIARLDVSKIVLEVRKENKAAQSLYDKFGFEQIAVRKDCYQNPKEDAFVYALEVMR